MLTCRLSYALLALQAQLAILHSGEEVGRAVPRWDHRRPGEEQGRKAWGAFQLKRHGAAVLEVPASQALILAHWGSESLVRGPVLEAAARGPVLEAAARAPVLEVVGRAFVLEAVGRV